MRLKQIAAIPHPDGNRIDLYWVNPDPVHYPGIRIVRRLETHPISPEDGVIVVEGENLDYTVDAQGECHYSVQDSPLKGETVYYYAWFPYTGDPRIYAIDLANRAAAMATSPYGMAGQMYESLPAIYRRYDAAPAQEPSAKAPVPLRRFLDLPGGQLDQLYSYARALLNLYDLDRVDGRLLPLLAQWIGWQTDYRLDIDGQRNEIRNAPYIYQTIGIIPTVEATVKRLLGWESRTKEFVHNVALSNWPERLNLWVLQRTSNGVWPAAGELLSLDFAYEGRAATVCTGDGTVWLFYHTLRADHWEIWYKKLTRSQATGNYIWTDSQPLVSDQYLNRHPAAVFHQDQLWVFWDAYDQQNRTWCLHYRTRTSTGAWLEIKTYGDSERRAPVAVVDQDNGLWLFWLEKAGSGWQLNYNRHDDNDWSIPSQFPPADGVDPHVESDVFVLFQSSDVNPRLWVFWARRERLDNTEQTRWQIAYRFKENIIPDASGWSAIFTLPKGAGMDEADDREPAAWVNNKDGQIELFWSSTRDGSWSIWRTLLGEGIAELVTRTPYSQRAPSLLPLGNTLLLIYRSNESLPYTSTVYTATETLDNRYAGCTTVDARNAAKIALCRLFKDFQTYTYDTGQNGQRGDQDWYARDTIGIYLTPTTEDPTAISENRRRLKAVLQQFLPIQVRAVFIIEIELVVTEAVYTYEFPHADVPHLIDEVDTVTTVAKEIYSRLIDSRRDKVSGWIWVCSWSDTYSYHHTVDFTQVPVTTAFRTWHTGYSGLIDSHLDTVPGWIQVRSWSNTYSYHHTVDFTQAPITTLFRTWHTGLTRGDFVIESAVYTEAVHTYEFPNADVPCLIADTAFDHVNTVAAEIYSGFLDSRRDIVPAWIWVRSWSNIYPDHLTVDLTQSPLTTSFRTWHTGLTMGN
jgi:hypothetical protein